MEDSHRVEGFQLRRDANFLLNSGEVERPPPRLRATAGYLNFVAAHSNTARPCAATAEPWVPFLLVVDCGYFGMPM